MLMTNNREAERRPGDSYSIGRHRDLDLNRAILVPLEHIQEDRFPSLRPINSEAYNNDADLRKCALKARSILAAAFIHGDLDAKYLNIGDDDFLLIGQTSTLFLAFGDFASLITPEVVEDVNVKGVLPTTAYGGGWRTQFGWLAMMEPEVSDHMSFYSFIRPSIVWFEDNKDSLETIVEQRGIQKNEPRTVEEIFKAALPK